MTFTPFDNILLSLGALALAAIAVWKVVLPALRAAVVVKQRATRALDVLNGSPAVPDPDRPGEFLRAEIPDMGVRMTAMEGVVNEFVLRNLDAKVTQAMQAANHAARDARLSRKEVAMLREASETWHADKFDVLTRIESRDASETRDGGIDG